MREQLGYAPPAPRHRRVGFVALVTRPILIASYVLALPKYQSFRDHQTRRADARKTFAIEIANAHRELDANNLSGAAVALFNAEFPTRIERHLFSRSTIAKFDRGVAALRPRLDHALANVLAEQARQRRQAETHRRLEGEKSRDGEEEICRGHCESPDNRWRTIAALHDRGAQQLQTGNTQQVLRICEQILILDPGHQFDAAFWANVRPKP